MRKLVRDAPDRSYDWDFHGTTPALRTRPTPSCSPPTRSPSPRDALRGSRRVTQKRRASPVRVPSSPNRVRCRTARSRARQCPGVSPSPTLGITGRPQPSFLPLRVRLRIGLPSSVSRSRGTLPLAGPQGSNSSRSLLPPRSAPRAPPPPLARQDSARPGRSAYSTRLSLSFAPSARFGARAGCPKFSGPIH